jgi:uncharacterized protein (DUF2336 family)
LLVDHHFLLDAALLDVAQDVEALHLHLVVRRQKVSVLYLVVRQQKALVL